MIAWNCDPDIPVTYIWADGYASRLTDKGWLYGLPCTIIDLTGTTYNPADDDDNIEIIDLTRNDDDIEIIDLTGNDEDIEIIDLTGSVQSADVNFIIIVSITII